MSSTANMDASVHPTNSKFTRYEVEIELPLQAALDVYFLFQGSSKKCSRYMANALHYAVKKANADRQDTVSFKVTYNDQGWNTWVLKTCEMRPHYVSGNDAEKNVEEFTKLMEGLS